MTMEIDRAALSGTDSTLSGSRLPIFHRKDLKDGTAIVVQFKIASDDARLRQEMNDAITKALMPLRLSGGQYIVPLITSDGIDMSQAEIAKFTALMLPHIKKSLGIP